MRDGLMQVCVPLRIVGGDTVAQLVSVRCVREWRMCAIAQITTTGTVASGS